MLVILLNHVAHADVPILSTKGMHTDANISTCFTLHKKKLNVIFETLDVCDKLIDFMSHKAFLNLGEEPGDGFCLLIVFSFCFYNRH